MPRHLTGGIDTTVVFHWMVLHTDAHLNFAAHAPIGNTWARLARGENRMSTPHKVAIVTGAGTGIGKCSALALLQDGYAVVLAGRRAERLEETAKAAEPSGSPTLVVPTDVGPRDPQDVRAGRAAHLRAVPRRRSSLGDPVCR